MAEQDSFERAGGASGRKVASSGRARMVSPSWTAGGAVVRTPAPLERDEEPAPSGWGGDAVPSSDTSVLSGDALAAADEGQDTSVMERQNADAAGGRGSHGKKDARGDDGRRHDKDSRTERRGRAGSRVSRRHEQQAEPLAPRHRKRLVVAAFAFICVLVVAAGAYYAWSHPAQPQVAAEDSSQQEELPDPKNGLADYSWQDLSRISQEISAQTDEAAAKQVAERFNILDGSGNIADQTKDVQLTDGTTLTMRVVGVYQDDKADGTGKAGLTFLSTSAALRRAMDDSGYESGWENTQMRSWLNNDVLAKFPDELASRVISVNKITNNEGVASDPSVVSTTSDRLWLPSLVELTGTLDWHVDWRRVLDAEGTQYEWFEEQGTDSYSDNQTLRMKDSSGNSTSWWTRSVSPTGYAYRTIDEQGSPLGYATLPEQLGVVVGFCL